MTGSLVTLDIDRSVATLTMDDGKRNALSPAMFDEIYAALERVERENAAVVITGREGVLSAGFDLKVMKSGGVQAVKMLRAGYALTARLLSFPTPVIVASPGHVYAMGVFMLLSGDYRFGVPGPYTYVANEVAIGLPMPRVACEVLRLRLTPAARERAVTLSEQFSPEQALQAGFIDALVPAEQLLDAARDKAAALLELDSAAHALSKKRLRAETLGNIRRALPLDLKDAVMLGVKQVVKAKRGR
ncbi:MAG: crotonase/enoyl-CoA hydratase family protein [Deltaproteobacteria bacterium]|nr:crotonase/enoyl-CoA hydratase family protein [Deltaproteobacteria bacterium]